MTLCIICKDEQRYTMGVMSQSDEQGNCLAHVNTITQTRANSNYCNNSRIGNPSLQSAIRKFVTRDRESAILLWPWGALRFTNCQSRFFWMPTLSDTCLQWSSLRSFRGTEVHLHQGLPIRNRSRLPYPMTCLNSGFHQDSWRPAQCGVNLGHQKGINCL